MRIWFAILFCRLTSASLDPIHGPREHPVIETFGYDLAATITDLDRQLWAVVVQGDLNLQNISVLITNGADPNSYDEKHLTALHIAAWKAQRLTITLLCSKGAYVDARDAWNRAPIHFAAAYGTGEVYPSTVTALYFCGANFNMGDQSHNTPLHLAAAQGYVGTVQQLVEYGAKLNATNLWGAQTPLGTAVEANQTAVVAALKALGATELAMDYIGSEPGPCDDPPCQAKCKNDRSNLQLGARTWGCYQNNFFMGPQPITEPAAPEPGQELGVIQGDCVT